MKFYPTNTLAHFNEAPQVHRHDLSNLPTAVLSAATLKYRKDCGQTFPNDEAVTFYALNHSAAIIRKSFTENEPLPEWARQIMQDYTDVTLAQGERILHYILSITVREMRHLHAQPTSTVWEKLESKFGLKAREFIKDVSSNGDESAAMNKYMKQPPDLTLGAYTKALAYAFHHAGSGGWSSGYGGKAWGQVTDALVSYVDGITSMEMLVDTGYTLAHNGGPIFNKGMMYTSHDSHLLTILDVQRGGQLLELMFATDAVGIHKTIQAINAAAIIKQERPAEIKGYVDWKLVDELRPDKGSSPGKYSKQIAAQKQAKAPAKPVLPVYASVDGKKAKVVGAWQVFPNQVVQVLERVSG